MNDFRKQMHVQYKKTLCNIISRYIHEIGKTTEDFIEYSANPDFHLEQWIDRNCLPMGDFSKEDAIKEIEEWTE